MKPGVLVVRADAAVTSGTGHVMRCLALAQAWQRGGGEAVFVMAQSTPAIRERLAAEHMNVVAIQGNSGSADDLRQTSETALSHKAQWLVVDGYRFDAPYLAELQRGLSVLLVDDNGEIEFYSSALVLNQNLHAREGTYIKRAPATRLLLGPRYALLRNEFTAYRNWVRKIPQQGTRVLLTMGGSDPRNLTPRLLSALAELPVDNLQIRVVVGGSADNRNCVLEKAGKFPGRVTVMADVANMAELMAWADLAVAGAGTTCWEMCLLGLPAILVVVAENQQFIAGHLARIGAAVNAGLAELIDCSSLARIAAAILDNAERRLEMSQSARHLVDGEGRERVLEAMQARGASCA